MSNKRKVVRAAGVILAFSIVGRLLGFVREQVIAATFGTSMNTDAYLMAFTIPNLIYGIIGGALYTAFIPVFTDQDEKGGRPAASRLASTIVNLTVVAMTAITIVGVIAAPVLVALLAPGFSPEARGLTVTLTRIMFPCVLLTTLSMLQGGVLNSLQHFAAPAFTSAAFSATVILSVYLLVPDMGIYGLAVGTVIAMVAQVLVQVPPLFGKGLSYSPRISLQNEGVRRIGTMMLPVMIGSAVNQVYIAVDRILASTLVEGSIAALNFGNKLMFLPFNLFVAAINTAVFPSLARLAARDDRQGLGQTLVFGLNLIALLTIPAAVGLFVLAEPIVRLLFEHGAFDARSTSMTVFALNFFLVGLFCHGANNIMNRTFYSLKDTLTPMKVSIFVVLLNIAFSLILIRFLQHGGLALANSLAATVNMLIAYWLLRKRIPDLPEKQLAATLVKVLTAGLLMGISVHLLNGYLASMFDVSRLLGQILHVGCCITFGGLLYFVLTLLFQVDEVVYAINRLRQRFSAAD